jgi:AcrR family transcriptional regulator
MTPRPSVEAERRQQILEAAMSCFAQKGYHLTTMDDIAVELPFSKGLLYYYFETKRDLFLAILRSWMDASMAAWETVFCPEKDAVTQICTCLNYGVQLLAQNTDLARIELEFYGELGRDRAISDAFKSLFADFRTQIKAILETGISRGEFRPLDADALAAVVLGIYEGLAMQAMVEPDGLDWPVVSENLCEMVMRGIVLSPEESS